MKTKLLLSLLFLTSLPFFSFKAPIEKEDTLYVYLKYAFSDLKNNTQYLYVSDLLEYSDWKDNNIEIKKKFASKAIELSGHEVWQASINQEGINESQDEVKIKREKDVQIFKNWHEGYGRKVTIYRVNLYRL